MPADRREEATSVAYRGIAGLSMSELMLVWQHHPAASFRERAADELKKRQVAWWRSKQQTAKRTRERVIALAERPFGQLGPEDLAFVQQNHWDESVRDRAKRQVERNRKKTEKQMRERALSLADGSIEKLRPADLDIIVAHHPEERVRQQAALAKQQRFERRLERFRAESKKDAPLFQHHGSRVQELSFELLPPGSWTIDDVVAHYRSAADRLPPEFSGRQIQWERIRQMESLKPDTCSIGRAGWMGYHVFAFERTQHVVLECPIEGNAIYVLRGDWEQMVRHSKRTMREMFPNDYVKVVHKGDWLSRVQKALVMTSTSPIPL